MMNKATVDAVEHAYRLTGLGRPMVRPAPRCSVRFTAVEQPKPTERWRRRPTGYDESPPLSVPARRRLTLVVLSAAAVPIEPAVSDSPSRSTTPATIVASFRCVGHAHFTREHGMGAPPGMQLTTTGGMSRR